VSIQLHVSVWALGLEVNAMSKHYKNGVGSLLPQQSSTWTGSPFQWRNPVFLLQAQIPWSNAGQDAHILSIPWVTSRTPDTLGRTLEVTCWLRLGAGATTLQTATSALAHSTAEYCTPGLCCSAHNCLIDPAINNTLRTAAGCLCPTPADDLPVPLSI